MLSLSEINQRREIARKQKSEKLLKISDHKLAIQKLESEIRVHDIVLEEMKVLLNHAYIERVESWLFSLKGQIFHVDDDTFFTVVPYRAPLSVSNAGSVYKLEYALISWDIDGKMDCHMRAANCDSPNSKASIKGTIFGNKKTRTLKTSKKFKDSCNLISTFLSDVSGKTTVDSVKAFSSFILKDEILKIIKPYKYGKKYGI